MPSKFRQKPTTKMRLGLCSRTPNLGQFEKESLLKSCTLHRRAGAFIAW